ncbi:MULTISPECIES: hypothetical protein [unclassified Methanoregula]|uniref:hypothetical protein n=1 Tax=unclassified Methanoregula TaxID=2649730 RepID=UPI0009CFEC69|nr:MULTISPECIES: hypothetical protein [unclassified Methanoregula]OPX64737.1 MAG: hypothetical protein A4E33_00707 [Methanoregula sp. PtaB.Bin085]OPY35207.1 MAG: hypothetical protein A4E34_00884 [Methanoregula sp. PtaU1.Bin006]
MPEYYRDARTGATTTKPYSTDIYGNMYKNQSLSLGESPGSTARVPLNTSSGGQVQVQQKYYDALGGSYGYQAMQEARRVVGGMTGRGIGSTPDTPTPKQPSIISPDVVRADIAERKAEQDRFFNPITNPGAVRSAIAEQKAEQDRFFSRPQKNKALDYYNPVDAANGVVRRFYTPEGRYAQQQLENVKVGVSESGELAYYERLGRNEAGAQRMARNPDTGALEPFILFGGAGRNAGQSGMFGFAAATPAVYGRGRVQEGVAGLVTPTVAAPELAESRLTGEEVLRIVAGGNAGQYDIRDYLARLGSEAYGGVVQFSDGRTLGGITYENRENRAGWNLARYLDPLAVNRGKADLPGANIPWSVGESTQPIFFMDKGTKSGESAPAFGVSSQMPAYFPAFGVRNDFTGLGPRTESPRLVLSARPLAFGDILSVKGAENLGRNGRLVGSKIVAGCANMIKAADAPFANVSKPAPAVSGGDIQSGSAPTATPRQMSWFGEIQKGIAGIPILGGFYEAGRRVNPQTIEGIQGFVTKAPILSNIAKGGGVFGAMKEYEFAASVISPSYKKMAAGYNERVLQYEKDLSKYSLSPTTDGYNALLSQKLSLDSEYAGLSVARSPIDVAEMRYKSLAAEFVGAEPNEKMATYGIASPLLTIGKAYREGLVAPVEKSIGKGIIQSAALGFISVPGAIPETIGMSIVGGERTAKTIWNFPGLAAAGGAMTVDSFVQDPVKFSTALIGTYGLFRAGGILTQKGIGLARTAGKEYVPLETIGYGPEGRYPLNPIQSGKLLAKSFKEGILYPTPKTMAEGDLAVPYLHGRGGHPIARLPNARAGEITLWNALESSSRTRGVSIGESYILETSGGSEVRGIYNAPILESYFLKVGNKPQMVGFELPFKTPTAYSTIVQGLESVPKSIRKTTFGGDWTRLNEWVAKRSRSVPAGQGYMPLLKAEYEAVIPDFSIVEITGRKYYTKIGGFGKSHFGGTRIPIVEQRSIGYDVIGSSKNAKTPASRVMPDYYRPSAKIGGYSLTAASALSTGYGIFSRSGILSTKSQIQGSGSLARSGDTRAIRSSNRPFSEASSRTRFSSSIVGASSALTYSELYLQPQKSISKSATTYRALSSAMTSARLSSAIYKSSSLVGLPKYSLPYTAKYPTSKTPRSPHSPPLFPVPIELPPFLPSLGGGGGDLRRQRYRRYTELFRPAFGRLTAVLFGSPKRAAPARKKKHRRARR